MFNRFGNLAQLLMNRPYQRGGLPSMMPLQDMLMQQAQQAAVMRQQQRSAMPQYNPYNTAPQMPMQTPLGQKPVQVGMAGQDYRQGVNTKPLPVDYWKPAPYEY